MDLDELARKSGLELVGEVHPFWAAFPWELRSFVNEVLEEAARECEARGAAYRIPKAPGWADVDHECTQCAYAIRSLKLK